MDNPEQPVPQERFKAGDHVYVVEEVASAEKDTGGRQLIVSKATVLERKKQPDQQPPSQFPMLSIWETPAHEPEQPSQYAVPDPRRIFTGADIETLVAGIPDLAAHDADSLVSEAATNAKLAAVLNQASNEQMGIHDQAA